MKTLNSLKNSQKNSLKRALLTLILMLAFAPAVQAAVELYAWDAFTGGAPFVIAVRDGELPKTAALRYVENFKKSRQLMSLVNPTSFEQMAFENFKKMTPGNYESQALVMANWGPDYEPEQKRIRNFARLYSLGDARTKTYVLPIAADLGLTDDESTQLRKKVIEVFSLLTAMGGDDVDPDLYDDHIRHSRNIVPQRDRFEISLIRDYTKAESGFMFGICRGHQLTSVALGYKLVQDLPSETDTDIDHASGFHDVTLVADGLLSRASGGQSKLVVNTFHHQAVVYHSGGPLRTAAVGSDGVIEALEFKNGRGMTIQFHPETMDNALGNTIMAEVIRTKNRSLKRTCTDLFRAAS